MGEKLECGRMKVSSQYRWWEILLIALLYIASARLSQVFAVEPGNVTPVWIPSGMMLALALCKGRYIWPGIFLGAFCGNIWAYISFESVGAMLSAMGSATLNGIGDVLSIVWMAAIIHRFTGTRYPLTSTGHFFVFVVFAVIVGPLISAIFGIGGLALFGFIQTSEYLPSLATWFIGDCVGALLFGPLLLSWLWPAPKTYPAFPLVFLATSLFSGFVTAVLFELVRCDRWIFYGVLLLLPIALVTVVHYGQRLVFSVQAIVTLIAIFATWREVGPFVSLDTNADLLKLQGFSAILALVIYAIAILNYERDTYHEKIAEQKAQLETLYRIDALTGLWNRFRISEFIQQELARFKRSDEHFGLLLLDIDDFKLVNDERGHLVGDAVLTELSQVIGQEIRESDLFGRWGGEEFVIIVTRATPESITVLGQKICQVVAQHAFVHKKNVSVSIGAALVQTGDTELTLLDRADAALYRSKSEGKNRVTLVQPQRKT